MAFKTGVTCGSLGEHDFAALMKHDLRLTKGQAKSLIERLTLPRRTGWNKDLPKGLIDADVFPWRYRRGLSLYTRPFVEMGSSPRSWMVSAGHLRKAIHYLISHIERGCLPKRQFRSPEMVNFVGEIAHQKGHEFAKRVLEKFRKAGFNAELEVKMTTLGAPSCPDLGDIDFLAWKNNSKKVFLVECKHLIAALTVTDAVQRLVEFKGDPAEKDRLAKHLQRIEWLKGNPSGVSKLTGIPPGQIEWDPMLVTNDLVPMQFLKDMSFPSKQFVNVASLEAKFLEQSKRQVET